MISDMSLEVGIARTHKAAKQTGILIWSRLMEQHHNTIISIRFCLCTGLNHLSHMLWLCSIRGKCVDQGVSRISSFAEELGFVVFENVLRGDFHIDLFLEVVDLVFLVLLQACSQLCDSTSNSEIDLARVASHQG